MAACMKNWRMNNEATSPCTSLTGATTATDHRRPGRSGSTCTGQNPMSLWIGPTDWRCQPDV